MRLKEFIIFIIIFTIIYFAGFAIFDHFKNKKDEEKTVKNNYQLLNINNLIKFGLFYNTNITINLDTLTKMYEEFKNVIGLSISNTAKKYNISNDEFVVIFLYLEYIGLISTKAINISQDSISSLNIKEDSLIVKYSLQFSNNYDYNTIIRNAGLGSDKEINYIMEKFLFPGVKLDNSNIYYVGDLNE